MNLLKTWKFWWVMFFVAMATIITDAALYDSYVIDITTTCIILFPSLALWGGAIFGIGYFDWKYRKDKK